MVRFRAPIADRQQRPGWRPACSVARTVQCAPKTPELPLSIGLELLALELFARKIAAAGATGSLGCFAHVRVPSINNVGR
jgi:hypothetical protein